MKKNIFILIIAFFLYPFSALARVPNDPNVEQWAYNDIQAFEAWDRTTGSRDVVVAVIDNGFDTFHPDIYPNVWKNEDEIAGNGIDDDNNGFIDDVWGWDFGGVDKNGNGIFDDDELAGDNDPRPDVVGRKKITDDIHHGTLVAGIIGAVANNNKAGAGINWNVRLMNVKALEKGGVGDLAPLSFAIRYAVDNGADIINISLVGDVDERVFDAVKYAYDNGVAVIAASGNSRIALNISPVYPVCVDNRQDEEWVLGVSAIGEDHYLAPFSSVGSSCIDITAPGVNIYSTMRYAPRYGLNKLYGGPWQGTSFAAPLVSATAALIKGIQPSWGPKQIYNAILSNVHRTPPTDAAAYEEIYGAGLLQIDNAVKYALSQVSSTHVLKNLMGIDADNGYIWDYNIDTGKFARSVKSFIRNADDIERLKDGFAMVKRLSKDKSEISFYSDEWALKDSWRLNSPGKLDIEIGDVIGDENLEVVVAPAYPDDQVMRIFSINGNELKQYSINGLHNGVTIGLVDDGNRKDILAMYNFNGETRFYRFNDDFSVSLSIPISFVSGLGSIGAGDINGDGLQEYIIGAGAGNSSFLAYYNHTGRMLSKFYAYDGYDNGGFFLVVGDYNGDGKDDIVSGRSGSTASISVWDRRSRKLDKINQAFIFDYLLGVYK